MGIRKIRGLLLAVLLGGTVSVACATDERLSLVSQQGTVTLGGQDGRQVVTTGADGRAVVRVGGSGFVVVERNSTLEIEHATGAANVFRQVSGMIFYAMNRMRAGMKPVQVRTATAVIGVRGTRFLVVEEEGRKEIGMRKGQVTVTSPREEFEIHRKQVEDEFAAFRKEGSDAVARERREFEAYRAQNAREFVEFKREFRLGKDRMVSFDGRRVTETALGAQTLREMESLEQFAADWLQQVED